jgi:hypothetical protein
MHSELASPVVVASPRPGEGVGFEQLTGARLAAAAAHSRFTSIGPASPAATPAPPIHAVSRRASDPGFFASAHALAARLGTQLAFADACNAALRQAAVCQELAHREALSRSEAALQLQAQAGRAREAELEARLEAQARELPAATQAQ